MSEGLDFFISYTQADRRWAEWIAWQLEQEHYTTRIQAWDFRPGTNFVTEMDEAVKKAKRTVLVLSPAYFGSTFAGEEWKSVFARNPEVLLPVRVKLCEPDGLLAGRVYVDLVELGAKDARDRLIAGIDQERAKPSTEPLFPGGGDDRAKVAVAASPRFPGDLPRIWTLTLQRNRFFKGRDQELKQIREALKAKDGGISDTVVLHGLGGIGKTQVAMEYAWYARDQYEYVFWVEADTPASLHANLAALSADGALALPEREAKEELVRLQAVRRWLASNTSWLLLVDNLDTEEAADAALNIVQELRRGHVLMTSRRADWPLGVVTVPIEVLPETDARDFLSERSQRIVMVANAANHQASVAKVAEKLGYLPLALEQAAAYVAKHRIDYGAYLERLASAPKSLLGHAAAGATNLDSDQRSVLTTWSVTEVGLGSAARAILRLVAFFAPEEIPRQLFDKAPDVFAEALRLVDPAGTDGISQADVKVQAEAGFIELADYSLIKLGPAELSCHRLQQDVQQLRLTQEERTSWITLGLRFLLAAEPGTTPDDVRSWAFWRSVRPHANALAGAAVIAGVSKPGTTLMFRLGWFLASKAEWVEAERLYRLALEIDERALGAEHPLVATRLRGLGHLLQATSRLGEAEPLMRRALAISERKNGMDNASVAEDLNNLAMLLLATDRTGEAESLMRRALSIAEHNFGAKHPRVAVHLNNLALLLEAASRIGEAEPLLRRALSINELAHGDDHPAVARALSSLASLLMTTSRIGEAEPLVRRALEIDELSYGSEHPAIAVRLAGLASLLFQTDRLEEAEPLMRRALDIDTRSYGVDHSQVAGRLNNLASLLLATNRLDEAVPLMIKTLEIDERSYGSEHPNVARDLNNLAQVLRAANRFEEAEPLLRRALTIDERSYGAENPRVATPLNNLALLLQATNRLGEAEPLMRRVYDILDSFRARTGHVHRNHAAARQNYEILLTDLGWPPEQIHSHLATLEAEATARAKPSSSN